MHREILADEDKRGFLTPLIVCVLVNAMLISINFLYSPEDIWFFYPLLSGGIGLTAHYLGAVRWLEKELKSKKAMAEYRARGIKKNEIGQGEVSML